ncbi:nucleotide-binding protein [Methanobrevibacter curvatus]|uniref:Phosphoribosylformylglycinamidine synthase 1 n=1 Tax=Methanobrevibacter curvatus TaxID=49547 RepID=A0A166BAH5_9EURY|nr:cobyrinic acid a,c-diamide synthase [Methanobrevibacter curvatus]KZX13083.1 phosphoribosylformylglycinamidine synthase 1 [Methanobrevibacter curvatus]
MKIGMAYIKGALPGFETFGNLPTDLVKSNGLVNGVPANKELDGLIIPGGSIVESESMTNDLAIEIKKMANDGKLILGICSGFQVISSSTDIGRNSPFPIVKKGLNLLDVNFSPMISNDRVEAYSLNESFLTDGVVEAILGFHCHTYGKISTNNKTIIKSRLKRANYDNVDFETISGVINDDGNVVGTMVHGILDNNPQIVNNIFKFLDSDEEDKINIFNRNKLFKEKINQEIAIDSGIVIKKDLDFINTISSKKNNVNIANKANITNNFNINNNSNLTGDSIIANSFNFDKNLNSNYNAPLALFIGSTSSDSGKTFITTGIAGALRKRGLNVGILKIGSDIRDIVPGLYLTNGLMENYASIKLGNLGWVDIENVLNSLKSSSYDIVLIEGAMSVLIGLLKDIMPYSGVEIAISSNIPLLLVSSVNKSGIESSAVDITNHINFLKKMGLKVNGAILNRIYDFNIFKKVLPYIKNHSNLENVFGLGKANLPIRGGTPEVEIKLEDFAISAHNQVEKDLDIELIAKMAEVVEFNRFLSSEEINNFFK